METLPAEMVHLIMWFLPREDLVRAACVCKAWRALALHPSQWTHIDLRDTAHTTSHDAASALLTTYAPSLVEFSVSIPSATGAGGPIPLAFPFPLDDTHPHPHSAKTTTPALPRLTRWGGSLVPADLPALAGHAPNLHRLALRSSHPDDLAPYIRSLPALWSRLTALHLAHIPLADSFLLELVAHLDPESLTVLAIDGKFSDDALAAATAALPRLSTLALNKTSSISEVGLAAALEPLVCLTTLYVHQRNLVPPFCTADAPIEPTTLRVLGQTFTHDSDPKPGIPKFSRPYTPSSLLMHAMVPGLTHLHLDTASLTSHLCAEAIVHMRGLVSVRLAEISPLALAALCDGSWSTLRELAVWFDPQPIAVIADVLAAAVAAAPATRLPVPLATLMLPATVASADELQALSEVPRLALRTLRLAGVEGTPSLPFSCGLAHLRDLHIGRAPDASPELMAQLVAPSLAGELSSLRLGSPSTPLPARAVVPLVVSCDRPASSLSHFHVHVACSAGDAEHIATARGSVVRTLPNVRSATIGAVGEASGAVVDVLLSAMPWVETLGLDGATLSSLPNALSHTVHVRRLSLSKCSFGVEDDPPPLPHPLYGLELVRCPTPSTLAELESLLVALPRVTRLRLAFSGLDPQCQAQELLHKHGVRVLDPWEPLF